MKRQLMQQSSSGPLKILGDSLRKNPEYLFKTVQQGVEILFSGKTFSPGVRPFYVTVTLSAKI